ANLGAEHGVRAVGVGVDVADRVAVRAAIDELERQLPPIVALANVAGVSSPVPYLELPDDEWERVLRINLDGVHHVTRRGAAAVGRPSTGEGSGGRGRRAGAG